MEFYLSMETLEKEIKTIRFHTIDTDLSEKWSQILKRIIDDKHPFTHTDRIYHLNDYWNKQIIVDKMNSHILKINDYKFLLDNIPSDTVTQELNNKMHAVFVNSKKYPPYIQDHLFEMNILIHRYEGLKPASHIPQGRIVVTFNEPGKISLEDEHFDSFTQGTKPEDVCLNYCHAGKHILEMFQSPDDEIDKNHIVTQHLYCANFQIDFGFGLSHHRVKMQQFEQWWKEKEDMFADLGIFRDDKKSAIGKAPVAKLIGEPNDIKNEIVGVYKIIEVGYV